MLQTIRRAFARKAKRPYKLFQIEPTMACNLECVMCPWTEMRRPDSELSAGTFARIAPYLPLAEAVDFTGSGEGTLHPRLPEMVRAAKAAGCQVGFSTNGVGLNEALARELIEARLDWISFSVDASSPAMYERIRQGASYASVMGNIARLRDLKRARRSALPKTMLVFVVMRENYHQLPDYIDLAKRLGVSQVIAKNLDVILRHGDDVRRVFSHHEPRDEVIRALEEAERRARRHRLSLRQYSLKPVELPVCEHNPLGSLFFSWTGEVSPCITLAYAEHRIFRGKPFVVPCQRYGNINAEGLDEIWSKEAYAAFRRPYEVRTHASQHALMHQILGTSAGTAADMPPAPEGCRSCYYLYGV